MVEVEAELARDVAESLDPAQQEDAAEMPPRRRSPSQRGARVDAAQAATASRIRAARAELEAEAKAAAAAKPAPTAKSDGDPPKPRGRKPAHPPGTPNPTAQRNFTDPESRIGIAPVSWTPMMLFSEVSDHAKNPSSVCP